MRNKPKTTGAMNKAEKLVIRLIQNGTAPYIAWLEPEIRKHLGIWSEYQDELAKMPPIPIEYRAAMELAHDMANHMRRSKR